MISSMTSKPVKPAYNAVAARQTLQRPADNAQPAQAPNDPWTPQIRDYVQRALAYDAPGVNSQEMHMKLKAVITAAAETGGVSQIDWSTYPLPQQLIMLERQQMVGYAPPSLNGLNIQASPFSVPSNNTLGKRKSTELGPDNMEETTPPWKKQATKAGLEDRITGKPKAEKQKKKKNGASIAFQQDDNDVLARRRQRFGQVPAESAPFVHDESGSNPHGPVVGTMQELEKKYFRLTSAPRPEHVRPLPVLKNMMNLLRKKWKSEHNYAYACDQFKSLRQDLTVQHIKTDFTVTVYEAHARIALEMGDLGEYNQCQTQLRTLYKMKLGGRPEEFTAYRILYFIYTTNRADMNNALADLTLADKRMDGVKHALSVRAALASGNYHKFFRLYQETPFMGAYLLDKCIPRERLAALSTICKSYKPDVALSFLVDELAFQGEDDDSDHGARECVQFLCDHGGEHLISRKDDGQIRVLTGQAKNIFEDARAAAFRRVDIKGQI